MKGSSIFLVYDTSTRYTVRYKFTKLVISGSFCKKIIFLGISERVHLFILNVLLHLVGISAIFVCHPRGGSQATGLPVNEYNRKRTCWVVYLLYKAWFPYDRCDCWKMYWAIVVTVPLEIIVTPARGEFAEILRGVDAGKDAGWTRAGCSVDAGSPQNARVRDAGNRCGYTRPFAHG